MVAAPFFAWYAIGKWMASENIHRIFPPKRGSMDKFPEFSLQNSFLPLFVGE